MELLILTISLDRVVSNTTEHRELGEFAQRKSLAHPREEMGQTVVASLHAFWNARATTREGQGTDTIRSEYDVRIDF